MEQKIRLYNDIDLLTFNSEDKVLKIEGYAAHFGTKNLNNEIVFKESFDLFFNAYDAKKIQPILNFEHDNTKQIGGIDEIFSDATGLYVKAHINRNIPYCAEWLIPNIENGDIKSFSTEAVVVGGRDGIRINEDGSYIVLNAMLTAVAVVQHPADWQSEFSVMNYLKSFPEQPKPQPVKWFLY